MRKPTLTREEIVYLLHGSVAGRSSNDADDSGCCSQLSLLRSSEGLDEPDDSAGRRRGDDPATMQRRWEQTAEALAQQFSSCFQISAAADIQLNECVTTAQFLLHFNDPCFLLCLQVEGSETPLWLSVDLPLVFCLLGFLLGGHLTPHHGPNRELTELEQRLAIRIAQPCLSALQAGWPDVRTASPTPQAIRRRVDPEQLAEKGKLITCSFTIQLSDVRGTISFAIPWDIALQVCAEHDSGETNPSAGELADRHSTLSVIVARTTVPASDLESLQAGDLIPTDQRLNQSVQVAIDGRIRFLARTGEIEGRKAIRIE